MQQTREVVKAGKRMGKKVMATDTAQDVVGVVVDGLEEVVVDNADDAADELKARAARAGGRSRSRAKKSTARKSTAKSRAKKSTAKKSTAKSRAKKSTAKKSTAKPRAKKSTAKKSTAKKSTAKKSTTRSRRRS